MSTVAEQLRQAREAKNLTIQQVAEATKIRSDHIEALEKGDFDVFPAPVYIRGFVRTYAGHLKLDVPTVLQELNGELAKTERHHEPPPLTPKSKGPLNWMMYQLSRINWRITLTLIIGGLILLFAVLGWRAWVTHKTRDPLAGLGPGAYQPKKSDGEYLPIPTPKPLKK